MELPISLIMALKFFQHVVIKCQIICRNESGAVWEVVRWETGGINSICNNNKVLGSVDSIIDDPLEIGDILIKHFVQTV